MAKIIKYLKIVKKCFGDARWSRYAGLKDKFEIFRILLRLSLKTEFAKAGKQTVTQKIFSFTITGSSFREILWVFREIFMEFQYAFTPENNAPKIIDCGANIGMAVLYFKRLYPESYIIAFEPNPVTFKLLEKNIAQNRITNIGIFNLALSGAAGPLKFYTDNRNSLVSSIDPGRGGENEIQVQSARLSEFIKNSVYDLAKIDVEGAEWNILQDLDESHSIHNIRQYIIEYHHDIINGPAKLSGFLKLFESNGFNYNLRSSFDEPGSYQDILIHFHKKAAAV